MNNPMQWPTRELFWAGLNFDEDCELTQDERRQMSRHFNHLKMTPHSTVLPDSTIVIMTGMDPIFGMVWQFTDTHGRVFGFGIRAADEMQARMSLGRANRILGRAGIDREAGVWTRTIFAAAKEGVTA